MSVHKYMLACMPTWQFNSGVTESRVKKFIVYIVGMILKGVMATSYLCVVHFCLSLCGGFQYGSY